METYTEADIRAAVELYAAFHEVDEADVDVSRVCVGISGPCVAFRLSLDGDGAQRGADEYHPDRETFRSPEGGAA